MIIENRIQTGMLSETSELTVRTAEKLKSHKPHELFIFFIFIHLFIF